MDSNVKKARRLLAKHLGHALDAIDEVISSVKFTYFWAGLLLVGAIMGLVLK